MAKLTDTQIIHNAINELELNSSSVDSLLNLNSIEREVLKAKEIKEHSEKESAHSRVELYQEEPCYSRPRVNTVLPKDTEGTTPLELKPLQPYIAFLDIKGEKWYTPVPKPRNYSGPMPLREFNALPEKVFSYRAGLVIQNI